MSVRTVIRAGFILLLFGWGIWGARHADAFLFLHGVNLLIHESGHLIFSIFGNEVLTALGGSLMQLFFPTAFTVYFMLKRHYYASAVTIFWIGQNFFDIAVYMQDARALQLPLIGVGSGDGGNGHDWNFLLDHWGILHLDIVCARGVDIIGWFCLFASLAVGLQFCDLPDGPKQPTHVEDDHYPE